MRRRCRRSRFWCRTARARRLLAIQRALRDAADELSFAPPVSHVYNPLRYAWRPAMAYVRRYMAGSKEVLFVGMNPGPWGMAQTGVPFGNAGFVRDWLRIPVAVDALEHPHPKRPVLGAACQRREVSGQRFWGWAQARFGAPDAFFERFGVLNYCPLCFLESGGRNRTPDKLAAGERAALFAVCNRRVAGVLRSTGAGTRHRPSAAFAHRRAPRGAAGVAARGGGAAPEPGEPEGEPRLGGASGTRIARVGRVRAAVARRWRRVISFGGQQGGGEQCP